MRPPPQIQSQQPPENRKRQKRKEPKSTSNAKKPKPNVQQNAEKTVRPVARTARRFLRALLGASAECESKQYGNFCTTRTWPPNHTFQSTNYPHRLNSRCPHSASNHTFGLSRIWQSCGSKVTRTTATVCPLITWNGSLVPSGGRRGAAVWSVATRSSVYNRCIETLYILRKNTYKT